MNLEMRIDALERSGRRWRLAAIGCGISLALIVLMGQAKPEPAEIKAGKFVLTDESGAARGTLAIENGGPSLVLTDARGREAIRLAVPKVPDKGAIYLRDGELSADLELAMTQNGPVVHLNDRKGKAASGALSTVGRQPHAIRLRRGREAAVRGDGEEVAGSRVAANYHKCTYWHNSCSRL